MDWLDLLAVQGSSPTPQFKSINSLALSFLYNPILTSKGDFFFWTIVDLLCFRYTTGQGNGTPLQYSCLEIHGWRSLKGCNPWGRWGSDTTEWFHFHFSLSCIGEGNGNPPQCSCLENPRDKEAWWAAIYGVTQSWTWLKWLSILSNKEWTIKILDTPPSTPKRQNLKSRLTHLPSLYSGPACVTPGVSGTLHNMWMSDTPHHFKVPWWLLLTRVSQS